MPRFRSPQRMSALGVFASAVCAFTVAAEAGPLRVDAEIPGGNIVVERISGDDVYLHQDLRDTRGNWFYWHFRVRGAAGRTLTFHFTKGNVFGVRGPAVSNDGGKSWRWLGGNAVEGKSFRYRFPKDASDVRFCFAMPYTQANLERFLKPYRSNPHLKRATLCKSKKGRRVERLHLGKLKGSPNFRVLLTCRHHACEMMASYVLEGILAAVLADTNDGRWLRQNVEFLVIPFVDKDGVEDGDQGKNRKPRDHNRDYSGKSLHPETKALREFVPRWSEGKLVFAMDMHDPARRDQYTFLVEKGGKTVQPVRRFARLLEKTHKGPLPFRADDNLPFGKKWNTPKNYQAGMPSAMWFSLQPGVRFAATLEFPYATARGKVVTPKSAREFGTDVARALRQFLETIER